MNQWHKDFFKITSDYGRIGALHWQNSAPAPFLDPLYRRMSIYWGFFITHLPEPNIMYGDLVPVEPIDFSSQTMV